jgi:RHS repeat-associated protein
VPSGVSANHELQCFEYDVRRRLVEAWAQDDTNECASSPSMGVLGGPAPYWNSYQHDVTGNRTGETLRTPGLSPTVRVYDYPAAGQPRPHAVLEAETVSGPGPSLEFDYDLAGNTVSRTVGSVVQSLSWDVEGRLVEVDDGTDTSVMIYDADGGRLVRHDGDLVTVFLPGAEAVWDTVTDDVEVTRYFTHAGQVVATTTGTDAADWTWMGVDHHGTTATHSVNAFSGVAHVRRMDPYGNERGTPPQVWPGQRGFVGGVHDPYGLVHIGARSYDPLIGRFISVDPILDVGDDQQINGYTYANANPIVYTDPTGLHFDLCLDTCGSEADQMFQEQRRKDEQRRRERQRSLERLSVTGLGRDHPHTDGDMPAFSSARWYERWAERQLLEGNLAMAAATEGYFCMRNWEIACELWGHFNGASGDDYVLDPSRLAFDPKFVRQTDELFEDMLQSAGAICSESSASGCLVQFDSLYHDILQADPSDPVTPDLAYGVGEIRVRLRGNILIEKGKDGGMSYSASYTLEIGKDWDFDSWKTPEPNFRIPGVGRRAVEVDMGFTHHLQRHGLAQEFFLTGQSRHFARGNW